MKSMKRLLSTILVISLLVTATFCTFADDYSKSLPEEDDGIFELAQTQADEAEEKGAEYDGFIIKIDPSETIDAELIDGLELIDEEEGLYTADSIESIESEVPGEIIDYIEPDYIMELFDAAEPNDPYFSSDQWNAEALNVRPLWEAGLEGQDLDDSMDLDRDGDYLNDQMIIAVIDSGLNVYHEDIDVSGIVNPHNVIENSSDVTDDVGHGTFVSGIIMAEKNNAVGIAGLGQSLKVMPVKVFEDKTTYTSYIVSAINYVVSQKKTFNETGGASGTNVSVINISFGGNNPAESLKTAINYAIGEGIIVICAAGNNGNTDPVYPAMYALGVGSYNKAGNVAATSQRLSAGNGEGYENKVWVCAPGEGLISTYRGNTSYEKRSGTSYSCPEISALAAICKGLDNSLNHYSFKNLLMENADFRNSGLGMTGDQDNGFGWGTVDFQKVASAASIANYPHEDGWYEAEGAKYYFVDRKGVKGWQLIDGKWYYFNTKGQMQTGWIKPYSAWYYLDNSGAMLTGWADIDGKRYYFGDSGAMATKWGKIDHKWYYFGESGAMQKGWVCDIDGTWYYLKEAGYIAVNEWVPGYWWLDANGAWTHKYKGSWHKNSTGWWFGDTTGWYARNTTLTINNVRYTFDENGYLK